MKTRAAKTDGETERGSLENSKPETAHENPLAPRVDRSRQVLTFVPNGTETEKITTAFIQQMALKQL